MFIFCFRSNFTQHTQPSANCLCTRARAHQGNLCEWSKQFTHLSEYTETDAGICAFLHGCNWCMVGSVRLKYWPWYWVFLFYFSLSQHHVLCIVFGIFEGVDQSFCILEQCHCDNLTLFVWVTCPLTILSELNPAIDFQTQTVLLLMRFTFFLFCALWTTYVCACAQVYFTCIIIHHHQTTKGE